MSNLFTDRQPLYPNRYKLTDTSGNSSLVTLERADEPTVGGTPLNAEVLNKLLPETGGTMTGPLTIGGELIWNGTLSGSRPITIPMQAILVEGVHYGSELPTPGTPGRVFFKKVGS